MATKTKITIGSLILLILATSIYLTMDNVKIRVDNDKSTFYVFEDSRWRVSGREYNKLLDGTKLMYRKSSGIEINYSINDMNVIITRFTPYIRGPKIKDTYVFIGDVKDVELFPISHKIEIFNATGYYYKYEVKDLVYSGETFKLDGTQTIQSFGRNMEVEWWEGYRLGWIYKNGNMYIKSEKIDSDYKVFDVRLFDPVTIMDYTYDINNNPNGITVGNYTIDYVYNTLECCYYNATNGVCIKSGHGTCNNRTNNYTSLFSGEEGAEFNYTNNYINITRQKLNVYQLDVVINDTS